VLNKKFYQQDTITIAKDLLGKYLVYESKDGKTVGKIVEVEAYLHQDDQASHSSRGQGKRNAQMFGNYGRAYIYLIYGMYLCFNVVTNRKDIGEAVLIRALEPVEGIGLMQKRRKIKDLDKLCNGPAKLAISMGITKDLNGVSLTRKPLYLKQGEIIAEEMINSTARVGITKSVHLPLRFYIRGNNFVSRK
jgi:DNA-3-methyladenine glycosylase